jgi:DnaA-homolog protein
MSQLALDLIQAPQPTLGNFVPGRNAEALAAARALSAGSGPQFVYLWGEAGCGRTHLLRALAPLASTVPAFSAGQHLYALDDVQALNADEQARLFVLINEIRGAPGTRLIAAGDAPPASLPLREDLRTRLAWGLVYQLHPLTDAEKSAALAQQAAARGLPPVPEAIDWLLAHLPRDMRTLAAALDALDAYALARKRSVTVALAREWLQQR